MDHFNSFIENLSFIQWVSPTKNNNIEKYIEELLNKFDVFYVGDVIEEIEKEMGHNLNSKAFILRVLRDFRNIAPYFLINEKKEYSNHLGKNTITIGKATYSESAFFCHKTLESYCGWGEKEINDEEISIYEKYVIDCFTFFELFFHQFDKLCLDYDIDIVRIQEENDIIVWIRNSHSLISEGYGNKIKTLENDKKIKDVSNIEQTSKLSLEDFLFNPTDKHKIPLIIEKFKNDKGKGMANAIYLLRDLNIFDYELNSKTKGRGNLAKLLNPNIKMSGVNMHFTSNTYNLESLYQDDLNQTKQWLNGL